MSTPSGNVSTDGQPSGKVVQIIGPVVDVEFDEKHLPPIYQALRIVSDGFDVPAPIDVIAEVQQHLGEGRVRGVRDVARRCPTRSICLPFSTTIRTLRASGRGD